MQLTPVLALALAALAAARPTQNDMDKYRVQGSFVSKNSQDKEWFTTTCTNVDCSERVENGNLKIDTVNRMQSGDMKIEEFNDKFQKVSRDVDGQEHEWFTEGCMNVDCSNRIERGNSKMDSFNQMQSGDFKVDQSSRDFNKVSRNIDGTTDCMDADCNDRVDHNDRITKIDESNKGFNKVSRDIDGTTKCMKADCSDRIERDNRVESSNMPKIDEINKDFFNKNNQRSEQYNNGMNNLDAQFMNHDDARVSHQEQEGRISSIQNSNMASTPIIKDVKVEQQAGRVGEMFMDQGRVVSRGADKNCAWYCDCASFSQTSHMEHCMQESQCAGCN